MLIESARKVVAEHTAAMVDAETGAYLGDAFIRAEPGMVLLDAFTASAIVAVYDALSPKNREKFATMSVLSVVDICWKVLKK